MNFIYKWLRTRYWGKWIRILEMMFLWGMLLSDDMLVRAIIAIFFGLILLYDKEIGA